MNRRQEIGASSRRWVVKVGSSLLTDSGRGLDRQLIASWVGQLAELRRQDIEVVLVSSGAVSEGMVRIGWDTRPHALHELQAAAAVGQMGLIQAYESCFQEHGLKTAQVLLTHDDITNRKRYLNAQSTLRTLIGLGIVPVINENDTVACDELRLGDNDTLAGMVCNLLEADLLVLLTDQNGMYDLDPRSHADASLIREAQAGDPELEKMAAGGGVGALGCGGMVTKVRAANYAARSGASTIIASGREEGVLQKIRCGEEIGTLIFPESAPADSVGQLGIAARKQWLTGQLTPCGRLFLNESAVAALLKEGGGLLPANVLSVEGEFFRGDLVSCYAENGVEVARGLVNYDSSDAQRIVGIAGEGLEAVLGYVDEAEMIHGDNLILLP